MSLKSRARKLQHATDMPYQKCLQSIQAMGKAPVKVKERTGWSLTDCDLFLIKTHAENEYQVLGITKEDLEP